MRTRDLVALLCGLIFGRIAASAAERCKSGRIECDALLKRLREKRHAHR